MTWHSQCQLQKFKRGFQVELKWRRHDLTSCPCIWIHMWSWHKKQKDGRSAFQINSNDFYALTLTCLLSWHKLNCNNHWHCWWYRWIKTAILIHFLYLVNSLVSVQGAKYLWRSSCQRLPKLVSENNLETTEHNITTTPDMWDKYQKHDMHSNVQSHHVKC